MSDLEAAFDTIWRQLDGPPLVAEYRFAPPRKWRFDRAHTGAHVAIEIDGGTHNGGRHVTGDGFARDCEKLNAAASRGWLVFRLTGAMLRDPANLDQIIAKIQDVLDD